MSAIINAIFGTHSDADQQVTVEGSNAATTERLHTSAVSDDVHVKSVISSETHANATLNTKLNINTLLSELNTTHAQVDQYSRSRTAAINEQVQKSIADVLTNTQRLQEELVLDANRRHLIIDNDYKLQLQKAVEALDVVKAKTLAELEHDLQVKQQVIMADAKKQIDILNDQANAAKLHALVEAQEQVRENISNLADQVGILGKQDTQNLLQSKTTTVITSQTQASGQTESVVADSHTQIAVKSPAEVVSATSTTTKTVEHQTASHAADHHNKKKGNSPSKVVSATSTKTVEHTTASGAATGASTSTASYAAVASGGHIETEVKPLKDNTKF
ncbi:unnamed protein product [Adineta steineri]|uniref:Uncharacterized protein n=1 Tax=Adineta steineri TaxID=433720 RepID=A0A814V3N8_9BILA|nr:unnamed protein product [Adineta steineri]CAF3548047.1 unnamed protein product [Adineta steineri]